MLRFVLYLIFFAKIPLIAAVLHPNIGLDTFGLAELYNYTCEEHKITTEDGYILTAYRISNSSAGLNPKPAVFVMHGLLSSSVDFLHVSPNQSLGFILADAGYDVWLGNQRGNKWSNEHINLDPVNDSKAFHNYSLHEIGIYDLSATIDYIIDVTKQPKIYYIGHSQGTTTIMILLSERTEYNDKLRLVVNLSPVIYINMDHTLIRILAININLFTVLQEVLGIEQVCPYSELFLNLSLEFCVDESIFQDFCVELLFFIGGADYEQFDKSLVPVIASNDPAGASVKQFVHYLQQYNKTTFKQYDYGEDLNLVIYGQEVPPDYDLTKITAPFALHYSENDLFSTVSAVERIAEELQNVVAKKLVPYPNFSHIDYLWAKDAAELVFNDVLDELKLY